MSEKQPDWIIFWKRVIFRISAFGVGTKFTSIYLAQWLWGYINSRIDADALFSAADLVGPFLGFKTKADKTEQLNTIQFVVDWISLPIGLSIGFAALWFVVCGDFLLLLKKVGRLSLNSCFGESQERSTHSISTTYRVTTGGFSPTWNASRRSRSAMSALVARSKRRRCSTQDSSTTRST